MLRIGPEQEAVMLPPTRPDSDRGDEQMLRSSEPAVRRLAISHLASPPREAAALLLLAHLDRETDPDLRAHAILSLKRAAPPSLAARVADRLCAALATATDVRERASIVASFALYRASSDAERYATLARHARPGQELEKVERLIRSADTDRTAPPPLGASR